MSTDPEPRDPPWYETGVAPDYRFSLANERTFLAWLRTSLAVLAGALILKQYGEHMHMAQQVRLPAIALAAIAAVLSASAYGRWKNNELAMRHGRSLPRPRTLKMLAALLALFALLAGIVLVL